MSKAELLQHCLTFLENGASMEEVLALIPEEHLDLRALLSLAEDIGDLEHPELNLDKALAQQRQVVGASAALAWSGRKPEAPPARGRWHFPALTAALGMAMVLAFCAVTALLAGVLLRDSRQKNQVILEGATGTVEVAEDGAWQVAATGDRVLSGKRLRTGPDSSVTLAFFEGSRTTLSPNSDITLTTLDGSVGDELRVLLTQHAGKTSHIVVPLRSQDSFFVVDAPNGRVTVRGTAFDVRVGSSGNTLVSVAEGLVQLLAAGEEVMLGEGQATTAAAGQPPELPTEILTVEGWLDQTEDSVWTVANIPFEIGEQTDIGGSLETSDYVQATGFVRDDGRWLALSISSVSQASETDADRPELQSTPVPLRLADCTHGQGYWKNHVANWPVTTLTLGDVSYTQVQLLAILTTPPRGDATYILAHQLIAAKLNVEAGADSSAVSATITAADAWLVANPLGSDPEGAEREEGITLAETLDDYNSGRIGPGACDDEPTPTPTATPTPTDTGTPTPTPTGTLTPTPTATTGTTDCTGADPHPHGMTLAERFEVSYEEIMGWFCSGFGFGEIELAYTLSDETGTPVEEIFAMRRSGLGWGQIKKELEDDAPGGGPPEGGRPGGGPPGGSPPGQNKDRGQGNNNAQGNTKGKDK